jgi:hypothetical protein
MLYADPVMKPIGAPIPEPGTYALMALDLIGVGWVSRRRTRARPAR